MWFDTILWLVAVVAFIMVEAATTALVSVWFAVGAAAAMLVSFFNVGFGWQMLVFAVVSAITLGLMLPRLISRRGAHRAPVTNGSPLTIGKQGVVLVAGPRRGHTPAGHPLQGRGRGRCDPYCRSRDR